MVTVTLCDQCRKMLSGRRFRLWGPTSHDEGEYCSKACLRLAVELSEEA